LRIKKKNISPSHPYYHALVLFIIVFFDHHHHPAGEELGQ
jgi:hypothetical protein